ncbi:hypothetical protein BDV09DRAFT_190335 [Aspergillus tetrazonus]
MFGRTLPMALLILDSVEIPAHHNEHLQLRLSLLDRGAPLTTLCNSPIAMPTEESPLVASSQPVSPSCCICLDTVQPCDLVHSIQCQHIFHAECLEFWYLYENDNCPLCHMALLPQASSDP